MDPETLGEGAHDVTPQASSANITSEKLPSEPPYDVLLTIISASNVPVGDLHGTSDVYVIGKFKNGIVQDDGGTSRVHFRTSTRPSTRDPSWNETWRFGGIREGTYLKLKLFDEDAKQQKDDKLGSVKLYLENLEKALRDGLAHTRNIPIRRHKGKKHIQVFTAIFDLCNPESYINAPEPHVTIKLQLLPPTDPSKNHIHLIGPTRYSIHYSPLANLVTTTPSKRHTDPSTSKEAHSDDSKHPSTSFKAYKIALIHPPPYESLQFKADMSHSKAFDPSKVHYRFLRHLVRKQYQNIYGHDKNTTYGSWQDADAVGQGLVDLLQPVENKLFTFVVTRDGEWRFCETGDEYKINHLSKHGMHANGKPKVAWSGEFFVRFEKDTPDEDAKDAKMISPGGKEKDVTKADPKGHWKIYLDNDSGTYSPDPDRIELFRHFMAYNLKGIEVVVKNFKDEGLKQAKKEQKGQTDDGNKDTDQNDQDKAVKGKNTQENHKDPGKSAEAKPAEDKPAEGQPAGEEPPKRKPRRVLSILKEEGERRLKIEKEQAKQKRREALGDNYYSEDSDVNPY